jgi:hypothetical protein
MKPILTKFAVALALAAGIAVSAAAVTVTVMGASASLAHYCVPQFDSSGAQKVPFC